MKNFCYFHIFFWWSIKFTQQNINQSETQIGDQQLSVELYLPNGHIKNIV